MKHAPATPLPWTFEAKVRDWEGDASYCISAATDVSLITNPHYYNAAPEKTEDAAYIAHAANAYPRLVEGLRIALSGLEDFVQNDVRSQVLAVLREIDEEAQ